MHTRIKIMSTNRSWSSYIDEATTLIHPDNIVNQLILLQAEILYLKDKIKMNEVSEQH